MVRSRTRNRLPPQPQHTKSKNQGFYIRPKKGSCQIISCLVVFLLFPIWEEVYSSLPPSPLLLLATQAGHLSCPLLPPSLQVIGNYRPLNRQAIYGQSTTKLILDIDGNF